MVADDTPQDHTSIAASSMFWNHTGSGFRLAIPIWLAGLLVQSGCECQRDRQVNTAIAWANENGMAIDHWQAGQLPDQSWDEQGWIKRGRSIPDVEGILQQLLRKPDKRIEPILVVRALGYVGTATSVPLLKAQLEDDWDVIRHQAIWSLGQIGGYEAIQALAFQVKYGRTTNERRGAALALTKIGDPIGMAAMDGMIENLREEQVYIEGALADLRRKVGTPDEGGSRPASRPAVASSRP
jgi:hypothetical protein